MREDEGFAGLLRDRIIDGELAPGTHLSETALATKFGISRNTVREGFRVLSERGLVVHVPNRGVSVASPTFADVIDIYRVRRTIERAALAQAEPTHPAVAAMTEAVEDGERLLDKDDWHAVVSANVAFHEAIVALADSPRLSRTFHDVAAELRLVFLRIDEPRSLHTPFVHRNRDLLTTLLTDGPEQAADDIIGYLVKSEKAVLGAFSRIGSD